MLLFVMSAPRHLGKMHFCVALSICKRSLLSCCPLPVSKSPGDAGQKEEPGRTVSSRYARPDESAADYQYA